MTGQYRGRTSLEQIRHWLNQPQRASAVWLGKHSVVVSWLGLLLAVVSPPHGSGISLCWFQSSTGLPCLGCGMTRSLSCGIRGMFSESWHYHPLGLFVLALFIFVATQNLCAKTFQKRIARFMQNRATFFNSLYIVFVSAFVSYGFFRAMVHMGGAWLGFR